MSLSVPERKKYITNRLIQLGYTPIQTAAIVGNLQQENSTFDPTLKNSIGATGIAQWLSKGRKDVLLQKDNPYSIDTQLEFLHEEIQGKTKDAWTNNVGGREAFMNAKTVEEATLIFRKDFERPGEHEAYDNKRTKYASEAMSLIDPNYQPPQNTETPTLTYEEIINNRISPADIWEMYKDEPSKAAELIAFKNEYEERLQKEAQEEKQAEVDLQKQALAQAQAEKQMVKNLLTTPTTPQEDYNAQIAQPQQPTQPFRFQTDWYIPQMAQDGGEVIYDEELSNLPEVVLTGELPEWLKYRREFEKNNPMGPYIYENRSMWANRQNLIDKYERETNQYIYDQLLKNNPRRSGESRGEYIQRIAGDDITAQDIIEQNKNRDSSTSENLYTNFARGYLGLSFNPFSKAAKTAIETKAYAPHEREQITNSPLENIGNMADILSVPYNATIGTLYTRGQGQDNYNMASGLSGRVPENRDTMLEIFGDPLNLVGVGSLSKADKVIDVTKAGSKVLNKTDELIPLYRIQEKNAKTFAELAKEGKIHPSFNTPEVLKRKANEEKYFGEWFTKDKNDLDWYLKDREFKNPEIIQLNVPKSRLKEFQNYDKTLSRAPDREFVVPKNLQKEFLNKTDDVVNTAKPESNIYKSVDNSTGPVIDFGYKPKLSPAEKIKHIFMNSREKQDFMGKKAVDDAFDFAERFMKDSEYLKRFKDIKSMTPSTEADEKDVINYIREGVRSGKIKPQHYSKEEILNMSDDDIAYNFADAYRYNTSNVSFQDKDKLPTYLNRTSTVPQQTSVQHLRDVIDIDTGSSSKRGAYRAGKFQSSSSKEKESVTVKSMHPGDLFNVTVHEVLGHGKTYGNVTFTQKEKELLRSVMKDDNDASPYIKEATEIMARIDEIRSVLNRDSPFRLVTEQDLDRFEKMVNTSTQIPGADSNKGSTMLQFIRNVDKSRLASVMNKMYSGAAPIGGAALLNSQYQQNQDTDTYQQGGTISPLQKIKQKFQIGGTVREIYEKKTGKDWSTAKTEGLTDGSYEANMRLRDSLLNGVDLSLNQQTPTSTNYNKYSSFNEAFKNARQELGANQIFEYKGRKYGTNIAGEKFDPPKQVLQDNGLWDRAKEIEFQNKLVDSPYTSKEVVKVEPEWVLWEDIKQRNSEIEKMSDADKIINYYKKKPSERYLIVDKQNARMHLYEGEKLIDSFEVGLGENKGDAQTVTKPNQKGRVDWNKGNMSTGAGIYTISNAQERNETYYGLPAFNLKNEEGIEVATAIHGTPYRRRNRFNNDNLEDNRMSYGCVNGQCQDLEDLYHKYNVREGMKVYILPEDEGNRFEIVDGEPVFRVSKKNRESYLSYEDSEGNLQKGQGGNYTTNTLKYHPIRLEWVDIPNTDVDLEFAQSLVDNKRELMKDLKIPGDIYNDIALLSLGILGQETDFGRSTRYWFKRTNQDMVNFMKKMKGDNSYNSKGLTQIKYSAQNEEVQKLFNKYGIEETDLGDPEKSAIATVILLGHMYNNELRGTKLLEESGLSWQDALLYLNQGKKSELINKTATPDKNKYIRNVKEFMKGFTLYQKQ